MSQVFFNNYLFKLSHNSSSPHLLFQSDLSFSFDLLFSFFVLERFCGSVEGDVGLELLQE